MLVIEDIVVKVGNTLQSSGTDLNLIGMSVKIASDPLYGAGTGVLDNITTAGRLNAGETAIGLLVDVSNVLAKTAEDDATKYAAIFAGGAVGISSGTSFDPEALFHIRSYQVIMIIQMKNMKTF